ncbi:MAG: DMT family transporter [Chloroflexi bacterium]|nr:DMT family transporter [Chloroflexota bacterium]MCY3583382.1 DMT family transporter [Chloroflexota bacterium]MCY3715435.1 DMT family transporter [Chloroflexota bacterium]MDE2649644.1 DMT family transporter [Chloroflexota bacterium]MXV94247.1 DMT family transporter [Chloroflexota bacterium]
MNSQASSSDKTPMRAYAVIVLAVIATSSAAILIRYALAEDMPPLLIAGARLAVATLALTPLALGRHRERIASLSRREITLIIISGLCLAAHFTAWVSSLQYTTVLVSVVIVSTGPIWVAFLEVVFLRIRLSRLVVAGLLVALAGGALIGIPLDGGGASLAEAELSATITGAILAWLGALTVSVYMLIGRVLRAQLPVIPYVWLVYGTASIAAALVMLLSGTPLLGFRAEGYLILLAMGLVPQLLGHSSLNYLLEYFPAALVSMFSQLEPIGSAVLALFLFRELPPQQQIIGSLLILVGVVLASRGEIRQAAQSG